MTIRARRAGRARHFQNPRAITRARFHPPTDHEEDPVRTTRNLTPEQLALHCEDQDGVRVRTTSNGGWLVFGPTDGTDPDDGRTSTVIPRAWEYGCGKDNVLAALRRIGVDLSALEPDTPRKTTDPSPKNVAKLRVPGPRPTLTYSKPTTPQTEDPAVAQPAPDTTPDPTPVPEVTAEDFLAALDRIERLEAALEETRRDLTAARIGTTPREQQAQQRRDDLTRFFQQLPTGFRVTAGTVYENLGVADDDRRAYGETLRLLVQDGVLTATGGLGERGGRHAHYQLATTDEAKAS